MGDPIIAIAPFLLIIGGGLLVVFAWRAVRLGLVWRRCAQWVATPAVVSGVSMREGRGGIRGASAGAPTSGSAAVGRAGLRQSEDSWSVEYAYDVAGTRHTGAAPWPTTPPPADGIPLTVHVDPAGPQRSAYLGFEHPGWTLFGYVVAASFGALLVGRAILAITHIGG